MLAGTAIGAVVALWTGQLLERWLYTVYYIDPIALIAAEATLTVVSIVAVLGPAIRAGRVDLLQVLRSS
jgi:ABC-type lipoprotein release transport system permease subunit